MIFCVKYVIFIRKSIDLCRYISKIFPCGTKKSSLQVDYVINGQTPPPKVIKGQTPPLKVAYVILKGSLKYTKLYNYVSLTGLRLAENQKVDFYDIFWDKNLIICNLSYLAGINTENFENRRKPFRISRKSMFSIKFDPILRLESKPWSSS